MVNHRAALLVIATAIVLVAGCAVPSQDSATRVPAGDVPFQLAEASTDSGTVPTANSDINVKVFLVRDNRLTIVNRGIAPADPPNVLALLAQGPSQAEIDAGLRTALVPNLAEIIGIDGDWGWSPGSTTSRCR